MKKNDCNVIRDLMPLVLDRVASDESRALVEEHMNSCEECRKQGRFVKATVVDHIVPHRGDQKLFWDEANWQPLCKPCHDKKTWNEDSNPTYKF